MAAMDRVTAEQAILVQVVAVMVVVVAFSVAEGPYRC